MTAEGAGGGKRADSRATLEEAAKALGVHYMTAYRYVRLGRLPAERHQGRWWVQRVDLDRLQATPRPSPGRGQGQSPPRWAGPKRRMLERLLAGDSSGSWAIVEQSLFGGATATDVYLQLLAPVLRTIGDRWAEGSVGIGAEHRATAVAMRMVGRLGPQFARRGPAAGGTVVLGGAPGDPHLLPLIIVSDVLRQAGMRVVDLGANLPERSFLELAGSTVDLRAVGISVSTDTALAKVARLAAKLHRAHPAVPVFVGGPAVGSEAAARSVGADGWAADAVGLVQLLRASQPPGASQLPGASLTPVDPISTKR